MNTAYLDRFAVKLVADYLSHDEEVALILKRAPGLAKSEVESLVKAAKLVRDAFKEGTLSLTLSTRKLLDYADFRKMKIEPKAAMNFVLMNWLDAQDRPAVSAMIKRAWPNL